MFLILNAEVFAVSTFDDLKKSIEAKKKDDGAKKPVDEVTISVASAHTPPSSSMLSHQNEAPPSPENQHIPEDK